MRGLVLCVCGYLTLIATPAVWVAEAADSATCRYSATSEKGNVYELTIAAEQPEVMKPLPVTIKVRDAAGAPLSGANIRCSLTMPAMAMPNNLPPVKATVEAGTYQSLFLLTMGGLWHAELSLAESSGGQDFVAVPIPGVASDQDDAVSDRLEGLFQDQEKDKDAKL